MLRGTPDPQANGAEEAEVNGSAAEDADETASDAGAALEKPEQTVHKEEAKAGNEDVQFPPPILSNLATPLLRLTCPQPDTTEEQLARFNNKRLCERWLDSLFMVLYEDLRIYTIWRTEMAQYRAQSLQYQKSAEEWEILGALATRLHHAPEAAEAYRACLAIRFSPKALRGILGGYEKEHRTRDAVQAVIRLITWQYRWYSEFSPELLWTVRSLIEEDGAMKVRSIIQASSLPQNVLELTHHYAALCAAFRSSGTEG